MVSSSSVLLDIASGSGACLWSTSRMTTTQRAAWAAADRGEVKVLITVLAVEVLGIIETVSVMDEFMGATDGVASGVGTVEVSGGTVGSVGGGGGGGGGRGDVAGAVCKVRWLVPLMSVFTGVVETWEGIMLRLKGKGLKRGLVR